MVSDEALTRLEPRALFDGAGYLSTYSDIAALMVFQHQSHMSQPESRASAGRHAVALSTYRKNRGEHGDRQRIVSD